MVGRNADDGGMRKKPYYRITSRVEIPASNLYLVWRGDEEFGPYTIQQIRHYWETGMLVKDDFIRESRCTDWIDAGSFLLPILTSEKTHPYLPLECPEPEAPANNAGPVEAEKIPVRRSTPWLKWLGGCALFTAAVFCSGCSRTTVAENKPVQNTPGVVETVESPVSAVSEQAAVPQLPLRVWGEPVPDGRQPKIVGASDLPAMPSLVEGVP
jgi:hypothetical protein